MKSKFLSVAWCTVLNQTLDISFFRNRGDLARFHCTAIPVCLWFLAKNKNADAKRGFRDRRKETLFIDARKLGTLIDRVHRERTDADVPGFCKSATTAEIAAHGHVLTPGRYVGAEEDDGDPVEEKMPRLIAELHGQFVESAKREAAIRQNLASLGFAPGGGA